MKKKLSYRDKLLESCIKILKPNGYFFAEDFAFHQLFNDGEKSELSKDFFANYIVSYKDYASDLHKAGFSGIVSEINCSIVFELTYSSMLVLSKLFTPMCLSAKLYIN